MSELEAKTIWNEFRARRDGQNPTGEEREAAYLLADAATAEVEKKPKKKQATEPVAAGE